MEPLFKYLENTLGLALLAWLIIIGLIVMLVWKVGQRYALYKHKADNLPCAKHENDIAGLAAIAKSLESLPCERNLEAIAQNRSDQDRHSAKADAIISEHTRRLDIIDERTERLFGKMMEIVLDGTTSIRKNSPYSITDYGEFLLSESHARECIDNNIDTFFKSIKEQRHSTPYDVERAAFAAVLDSFRTDMVNPVKDYLYNAPGQISFREETHRLDATDIQAAMAIYLRDRFLKERLP